MCPNTPTTSPSAMNAVSAPSPEEVSANGGATGTIIAEYAVVMRTVILGLAVAAALAACGSGGGGAKTISLTSSSTAATTSGPASHPSTSTANANERPRYRYPATVRAALVAHCRQTGSRSACKCVLGYFEGNFSYAQLRAASVPKLATWAARAASVCSGV
jgi:hypothetical protein